MDNVYKVNEILEIDYKCRGFCKLPYHGHKNGCPNFGKHNECPPKVGLVDNIFDIDKDMFFIVEEFDLKAHVDMMKQKHPTWSYNQLKNLLYWQGGVRKRLNNKVLQFIGNRLNGGTEDMIYTLLPEAMGVMVINTSLKLGIPIERTPVNKVFKIALVGYRKKVS